MNQSKEDRVFPDPAGLVERALAMWPPEPGQGPFESRAFYELCQHYRTRPLAPIPDVVDAFEALKLFGARFLSDTSPRWVRTDDKRPEDEQRVLGWWPAGRDSLDGYDVVLYHAADAPDGPESWHYTDESSADDPDYWMPLEALGSPK